MLNVSSYDAQSFGAFLTTPQEFVIDLSNCNLIECIEKFVEIRSVRHPKTRRNYTTLLSYLYKIQFRFHTILQPIQITDVFWEHFIAFLLSSGTINISSAKTLCSQLRSALTWSNRHNANVSPTFDLVEIGSYKSEQISLTPDEISHIYHFDLSSIKTEKIRNVKIPIYSESKTKRGSKRLRITGYKTLKEKYYVGIRKDRLEKLERTKDALVLSCNLGCRHSDLVRISKENFERNKFKILQQKTGTYAYGDIDKFAIDSVATYNILEKYNYEFPFKSDISVYNKNIHELLKLIGEEFNEEVVLENKVNGEIKEKRVPKWRMIASHTGRRTFVTHNVLKGLNIVEIKKASGHKSLRSFEGYICEQNLK